MWGEISSSRERCFPQVNSLWWKSWRRWSLSATWTLWSILNTKGHSTCLILSDESAILICGCKNFCQLFSKKTTSLLFQVFICEGEKNKTRLFLLFLYRSLKPVLSLQKVAEFPISVQLGVWAVMPISPLSLWNKPNIMFKSNTSVDEIFFFFHTAFCHQIQDPGYCFWMTALTLSWRHLFCSWVAIAAHCPLSKLPLKTGSAEKIFCQ